jgi:hypothetical protein
LPALALVEGWSWGSGPCCTDRPAHHQLRTVSTTDVDFAHYIYNNGAFLMILV